MVNDLPKEIGYSKVEYLELLMEHPDGLTPRDVSDVYLSLIHI